MIIGGYANICSNKDYCSITVNGYAFTAYVDVQHGIGVSLFNFIGSLEDAKQFIKDTRISDTVPEADKILDMVYNRIKFNIECEEQGKEINNEKPQ
jgi:hypothetical protein